MTTETALPYAALEARYGVLLAAARAVLLATVEDTVDDEYPESGRYCGCCESWIDADGHEPDCPIPHLATLVGDGA
jgi:hypothetical protein